MVQYLLKRYPRYKIANDGDYINPGNNITTPSLMKGALVALAQQWQEQGLITSLDAFKKEIIVERHANDADRVNIQISPTLIGQLRQLFIKVSFQY